MHAWTLIKAPRISAFEGLADRLLLNVQRVVFQLNSELEQIQ
jgi:hypothetical protein